MNGYKNSSLVLEGSPPVSAGSFKPFIIPLFIPHRGCPFQCLYCNQEAATGVDHSANDSELTQTVREWPVRKEGSVSPSQIQIAFYGGSFTSLPLEEQSRLLALARPFILNGEVGSRSVSPPALTPFPGEICVFSETLMNLPSTLEGWDKIAQFRFQHVIRSALNLLRTYKNSLYSLIIVFVIFFPEIRP